MRKDIEDGRADKQKKKEDEVKEKGRKGKNAHDKDKNGLTEDDKKKHKQYLDQIVQKLKADKGNNAKTFKEFHASKVKLAKDLEGRYQPKLKKVEASSSIGEAAKEQVLFWLKRGRETGRALVLFYY